MPEDGDLLGTAEDLDGQGPEEPAARPGAQPLITWLRPAFSRANRPSLPTRALGDCSGCGATRPGTPGISARGRLPRPGYGRRAASAAGTPRRHRTRRGTRTARSTRPPAPGRAHARAGRSGT